SGTEPWSYHLFNLLIHLVGALLLWGLLGDTFVRAGVRAKSPASAHLLAFLIALLWALHPLQTESVTYIVQRVESLAAAFVLLSLWAVSRGLNCTRPRRWWILAIATAAAGVATKETAAVTPLLVALYDRAFAARSWGDLWERRRYLHLGLASTWLLAGALVASTAGRGGSAGFTAGVSAIDYSLTQAGAILHYLRLVLWPAPLVFDYGTAVVPSWTAALPALIVLVVLLSATVWAVLRRPPLGFAAAAFFILLAPSSSVVPIATQTMAEHRMYLALAPVLALVAFGLYRLVGGTTTPILLAAALLAGATTYQRNHVYASELALWSDTVRKRPENPRARVNLGAALIEAGRLDDAIAQYEAALRLRSDAAAHSSLCAALTARGQADAAIPHGEAALRLDPTSVPARVNLANALVKAGQIPAAIAHYREALRHDPSAGDVHLTLAAALFETGDVFAALRHYEAATTLRPSDPRGWLELARARAAQGEFSAAQVAAREAARQAPESPEVFLLLGTLAAETREFSIAAKHYRRVVELAPTWTAARVNLGNALLLSGQAREAVAQYREVLRTEPGNAGVRQNLDYALRQLQEP
ncbi:MAG TPA: tetratricopeptide repeat protein, partial [Candidatus Synoicihabitans sp.]|nr:tetratricopeptide repeat protein [Candidatus Synoicihabitans sp.]